MKEEIKEEIEAPNLENRDFSDLVLQQKNSGLRPTVSQSTGLSNLQLHKTVSTNDVKGLKRVDDDALLEVQQIPVVKKTASTNDLTRYQKDLFINQSYFSRQTGKQSGADSLSDSCGSDCLHSLKETMSEMVKKKTKLIFFADRQVKIYENGYFAYFTTTKKVELKALIKPKQLQSV